uniref:propanoyl-CoA C-acyltransferase n=1 Tax=Phlebotomus papatasi TaxID=29031 RepID=A0A1B0D5B3_PHLPP
VSGKKISDIIVIDNDANELITYEALGLCPPGKAGELIDRGDNTYGGKYVINPSGGLISKGHPLGATGLAQCSELCWQLRGEAGKRQVKDVRLALQHNLGLGGAVVVSLYRKGFQTGQQGSSGNTGSGGRIKGNPDGFKVSPYMEFLSQAMEEDEENLVEKFRGVYGFKVTGGPNGQEGYWIIDAKQGKGTVIYNGSQAVQKALADAKVDYSAIKQAFVGFVYGDSCSGQRALYDIGMTGIPIYNVNNNCSTGSSALFLAKQLVESGVIDCALALGFEKMERGSLSAKYFDRANPSEKLVEVMGGLHDITGSPITAQFFGNAGLEHMKKFGTKPEHFAKIAYKNHKHSVNNPYSQFQDEYTLEQIMKSPSVHGYLTKLQCCPTSDGAAACVLASEEFVKRHGLEANAIEIVGMEMATDLPSTHTEKSMMKVLSRS